MEENYKIVRFDLYCKQCKYKDEEEAGPHCNECLMTGARENTVQPLNYKAKDGES